MFGVGMDEMLVILVIVFVIFGAGKLPDVCGALGKGVRNFKKASQGMDEIEVTPEKKEEEKKKIEEKKEN
jgi:sec-independent protein translocase protein TatA